MKKLAEVEQAKAVMAEAMEWSVMRWLREKKRVRRMADSANEALDGQAAALRENWPADVRRAYESLHNGEAKPGGGKDPLARARQSWDADQEARRARDAAEQTFDEAERQLSARLAREGAQKAIASWELHERALAISERLVQKGPAG